MDLQVTAVNLQGAANAATLKGVPDTCPRCHKSVHPKEQHFSWNDKAGFVQVLFRCTSQSCQELFIGTYVKEGVVGGRETFRLILVSPQNPIKNEFTETINELSPTFVEVYNQALAAEAAGLDQIVGIGIRKSLEFLVKDFAGAQNPDSVEEIKSKFLGACIDDYIDDANVKACAKRAAWLGNDESHYLRKWADKDISDLKLLVKLTVNWVENVLLTKQYIEEMEPKK